MGTRKVIRDLKEGEVGYIAPPKPHEMSQHIDRDIPVYDRRTDCHSARLECVRNGYILEYNRASVLLGGWSVYEEVTVRLTQPD